MRRVTGHASFGLNGSVFVHKWSLLVHVTLNAYRISAGGQSRLFKFEAAVRVMAIGTLQRAFEHFVMEG